MVSTADGFGNFSMMKKIIAYHFILSLSIAGIQAQPINESPDDLYKWGLAMTNTYGVDVVSSKPMNGYVVKRSGERVEGLLKLKKKGEELSEISIKAKKKYKFSPTEVDRYGLLLKIIDVSSGEADEFPDDAKNFHPSTVFFLDDTEKTGLLAFRERRKLDPNKPLGINRYMKYYFAEGEDAYLTSFSYDNVKRIVHNKVAYYPINNGFAALDDAEFNKEIENFYPGKLTLTDGSMVSGDIKQKKVYMKWYSDTVYVKSPEKGLLTLKGPEVTSFTQEIEGRERTFISVKDFFVEKLFDGKKYLLYRNPYPSLNLGLTVLAQSAAIIADDEVSNEGSIRKSDFRRVNTTSETRNAVADVGAFEVNNLEFIIRDKDSEEEVTLTKQDYKTWFGDRADNCKSIAEYKSEKFEEETIILMVRTLDACY